MRLLPLVPFLLYLFIALTFSSRVFHNPVIPGENNPDPGAIFYKGAYYIATTVTDGLAGAKFPIHRSADLQNWEHVGDVFPEDHLPVWTNSSCSFWAPEIHIINGQFYVYFVAREASTGILCVGVATSDNILGPYNDMGAPLIKNTTVGSIDPTIMSLENNTHYILWKDDGNANKPQIPTCIWIQELTSNGLATTGPISALICNDLPWEGDVVEAPWVVKREGWYYLFYSGYCCCDATYAVGVARSRNPLGPYEKKGDPILKSNNVWIGPGHCCVMRDYNTIDKWVMIYHSWYEGQVCENYYNRMLMVDYVHWGRDGWPYMERSSPSLAPEEFFKIVTEYK